MQLQQIRPDVRVMSVTTDQGTEFKGKVSKYLKEEGVDVHLEQSYSHTRTGIVESLNRTIRGMTSRYMYMVHSFRWYDLLPEVMRTYNHSKHDAIGTTPYSIMFDKKEPRKQPPHTEDKNFQVGDYVRYSLDAGGAEAHEKKGKQFSKISDPKWSERIYVISRIEGNLIYIADPEEGDPELENVQYDSFKKKNGDSYKTSVQETLMFPNERPEPFTQYQLMKTYAPEVQNKIYEQQQTNLETYSDALQARKRTKRDKLEQKQEQAQQLHELQTKKRKPTMKETETEMRFVTGQVNKINRLHDSTQFNHKLTEEEFRAQIHAANQNNMAHLKAAPQTRGRKRTAAVAALPEDNPPDGK
jgi:hypothetical protein